MEPAGFPLSGSPEVIEPTGFIASELEPLPKAVSNCSPFRSSSILLPRELAQNSYLTKTLLPLFTPVSQLVTAPSAWDDDLDKTLFVDRRCWASTQDAVKDAMRTSLAADERIAVWEWAVLETLVAADCAWDSPSNRRALAGLVARHLLGVIEERVAGRELTGLRIKDDLEDQGACEVCEDDNPFYPRVAAQHVHDVHPDQKGEQLTNVLLVGGSAFRRVCRDLVTTWFLPRGETRGEQPTAE